MFASIPPASGLTTFVPYPCPRIGCCVQSSRAGPRSASRPLPLESALPRCSAMSPPGGKNEFLMAPSVPGSATCVRTTAATSAGQRRRVSRGRSQRKTSGHDEEHDHARARHRRGACDAENERAERANDAGRAGARGRSRAATSITSAALRAIGCCAEANTRSFAVPTRWKPPTSPRSRRKGITVARWLKTLKPDACLDDREDRHDRTSDDEAPREEVRVCRGAGRR